VNIAQTYSTPPHDSGPNDQPTWPVLARILDVSTEARPPQSQRPAASDSSTRRVDPPQPRAAATVAPTLAAKVQLGIGKHSAHSPQPPAHHLNQRAKRAQRTHDDARSESSALPNWDPFSIPGKRLPDAFAPIFSFLAMVVLFTAAGTSILLLRNRPQQPVSEVPPPARLEQTAAVSAPPTAVGPLGASASRLLPAASIEPAAAASHAPTTSELKPPADVGATGNGPPEIDLPEIDTEPAAAPTADTDRAATEYPEPIFPPMMEVDSPQAAMTDTRLPVARFSGEILEAPTRQARHDDQSSIH
jgi:hypothetical protein